MSSDVDPRQKRGSPGLPLLLLVALGAFALGAWIFRGKPAPAPVPATIAAPDRTRASSGAVDASPIGSIRIERNAERDPRLAALREQLSMSVADVLQALSDIGATDPARAIALAHELGRTDAEKAEWVKISMQQWADRDVQAAWQWLREQSFERKDELAGGDLPALVLGTMAAQDPSKVLGNLDALLRQGNTSESISTPVAVHLGVAALVENGQIELARQAVEAWAKDPSGLNIEAAAYETVAMALAPTAPLETGEWLRAMPPSQERNDALATFTATWAEHDPRAALQWAETLPPTDGQQAALGRTVSDWIERYPDEVSGWLGDYLSRVPPSAETDTLIQTVINVSPTVRADARAALQWANLISDPVQRTAYEEKIAVRWGGFDRAAATDYVWKSPTIPPERKSALVQEIQNAEKPDL